MKFSYRFPGEFKNFKVFGYLLVIITNKRIIFYNTEKKEEVLEIIHSLSLLDLFLYNNEIYLVGKTMLYKIQDIKIYQDTIKEMKITDRTNYKLSLFFNQQKIIPNDFSLEISGEATKSYEKYYSIKDSLNIINVLELETFSVCTVFLDQIVVANIHGIFFYNDKFQRTKEIPLNDGICTKLLVKDKLYLSFENGTLYSYDTKLNIIIKMDDIIISFDIGDIFILGMFNMKIYRNKKILNLNRKIRGVKILDDKIIVYEDYILILNQNLEIEEDIKKKLLSIEEYGGKVYLVYENKIEEFL
ncbi:hypothetical protein SLOPH_1832 [Spraguea lophii 42_110]|uniref:Uncharacterized protein n=1 Tax=Spraguea lophii (strain 42_110) TaxID=1358809 RepID=S7WAR0_SPRLO|nr:hypothetical protein SLOPH_1832 [Spraguea lophii 42_110]